MDSHGEWRVGKVIEGGSAWIVIGSGRLVKS